MKRERENNWMSSILKKKKLGRLKSGVIKEGQEEFKDKGKDKKKENEKRLK